MRKSPDEREILTGCLRGEKTSWDAFVERYSRLIFWGIRRTLDGSAFGARPGLADEIFQEIFERLLDRAELAKLRDVDSLKKFLSVIACHATMDKVKHLSRWEARTAVIPTQAVADPSELAARGEIDRLLEAELGRLSPKERTCVEWHYLDGRTHREIGLILGLPLNTVTSIIHRTRQKLGEALGGKGLND
ncbi:MAG: hypothetical protein A3D28_04790 [Omnitrophica bacterium RIFCSPHIGHO2_02_FULL_63_14]|nr:MAG: hypothetical protein A3D28_04790 [Omnitrophica bacterium RIFCSPHIGHO2_02_FULL_63_14]